MNPPTITVVVAVEGDANAYVHATTFEEQERVRLELSRPNLIRDISAALGRLRAALEDMSEAA